MDNFPTKLYIHMSVLIIDVPLLTFPVSDKKHGWRTLNVASLSKN